MRQALEKSFTSFDGSTLFYRYWPGSIPTADRALLLFHRGHEHSGRLQHVVDELDLGTYPMFAWDARGHGRSPGERGYSPSLGASVKDVDSFVAHVSATYAIPMENIAIIAQSVGSVLVATWVHDYAPKIRCMILASPAFKVKLYVPCARAGLRWLHRVRGKFFVNSYVKAKFLTHDAQRIASYNSDPLITRPIAVNILLALYDAAKRVIADAGAIQLPTQLLISGADWVVHHKPQHQFFERLGSPIKEKHVFAGFYHDTLGEKERHLALNKAREFLLPMFENPPAPISLLNAHQTGYTKREFDCLSRVPAWLSPAGLYYGLARLMLSSVGRLSVGVRLGLATGFDSGSTLDYVYLNKAQGISPLGRLIDRAYLDAIGWRGIRVRKQHIEHLLNAVLGRLRAAGRPVRIVDIAAGHGRYVLEALAQQVHAIDRVLLRDYSDINVAAGRKLITAKAMDAIARFEKGDAFDGASLAALHPKPTLAVVSGLYELFPDNAMLATSLAGLAQALETDGYLIYTNQPWHPQLEFIARVLSSHRGHVPWIMRRRTQLEMDQLVAVAGFQKLDQLSDEWGIFSVSVARKRV